MKRFKILNSQYETTMRKSFSHRRMIIGSSIWQLKNKL